MKDILAFMESSTSESAAGKVSTATSTDEEYTPAETEAISRIQRFWRSHIPKVKQHREYMRSPKGQAIQFYIDLSSQHSFPIRSKVVLVSRGVAARLRFPELRDLIAEQHKRTMSCLTNTETPTQLNETLDDAVQSITRLNHLLKEATDHMAEERLGLLSMGEGSLEDTMRLVERLIGDVEQEVEEVRIMIDEIIASHP